MKVFLVRHAEAQPYSSDPARHLTERGRQQVERVGRFLRERAQFDPVALWHSGLPRALETAEVLRRTAVPGAQLLARSALLPEAPAQEAWDLLLQQDESVALVGHHPQLHELFALMMGSQATELWEIVKAGVVCINGHDYYSGLGRKARRWSICWMITPRLLPPSL